MIQVFQKIAWMIAASESLEFGCRTFVGFKGADFLITNSIVFARRFNNGAYKPAPFTGIVKSAALSVQRRFGMNRTFLMRAAFSLLEFAQ